MKRNAIFAVIFLPCLLACGGGGDSGQNRSEALASQARFDLAFADFAPSQSSDGSRVVFLSRRNDSIASVMTFTKDRPEAERLQTIRFTPLTEKPEEVRLAMISPDGEKIIVAIQQEADVVAIANFDGSIQQKITDEQLQGFRIERLSWADDNEVFAIGAQKLSSEGILQHHIWLGLVRQSADTFVIEISEGLPGREPVLINDGLSYQLAYISDVGDSYQVLPYTHDGQVITIDSVAARSVPRQSGPAVKELFDADAQRIYYSKTEKQPRVRARWGNREPSADGVDNIGKLSITQTLNGLDLATLESSDFLNFEAYATYETADLRSLNSTRSGALILLVGTQFVACEKLNLSGNQILLVHTGLQTVFPLLPKINDDRQVTGLVTNPCIHVDESRPANNQPFDFRINSAHLTESAPGQFVLVYESRLLDHLEIFRAEFTLPNLETAGLSMEDLEIVGEVSNISNNHSR